MSVAGEVSRGGEPGAGAEGQVPDSMAELILDLPAEGPGALTVYGNEDVEWAAGHGCHCFTKKPRKKNLVGVLFTIVFLRAASVSKVLPW